MVGPWWDWAQFYTLSLYHALASALQNHAIKQALTVPHVGFSFFFFLHFLTITGLKNYFQYLGISKLSTALAASYAFVFVLWLYFRGHTCWTWFFPLDIARRSKRFVLEEQCSFLVFVPSRNPANFPKSHKMKDKKKCLVETHKRPLLHGLVNKFLNVQDGGISNKETFFSCKSNTFSVLRSRCLTLYCAILNVHSTQTLSASPQLLTLSHTALDTIVFSWNTWVFIPDPYPISQLLSVYHLPCHSRQCGIL